jgi:hypothetical protein
LSGAFQLSGILKLKPKHRMLVGLRSTGQSMSAEAQAQSASVILPAAHSRLFGLHPQLPSELIGHPFRAPHLTRRP